MATIEDIETERDTKIAAIQELPAKFQAFLNTLSAVQAAYQDLIATESLAKDGSLIHKRGLVYTPCDHYVDGAIWFALGKRDRDMRTGLGPGPHLANKDTPVTGQTHFGHSIEHVVEKLQKDVDTTAAFLAREATRKIAQAA